MKTFIDLCLEGKAKAEDCDDFIDKWHSGEEGQGMELQDYLGMTDKDYDLFGEGDEYLPEIINNHRKDKYKQDIVKMKDIKKDNSGKELAAKLKK